MNTSGKKRGMATTERVPKRGREKKPIGESHDREMELTEHLAELRARIMRSILYVLVCMVVVWFHYPRLYALLTAPVMAIKGARWDWIYNSFMEPFFVQLQICAVAGVILAFPGLLREAWGFVAPALTRTERRAVYFVGPLCIILFFVGVMTALWVLPPAVRWFLSYLPPEVKLLQRVPDYVIFLVKLCLAFGIVFQLPVAILFLGKVGLVNSRFLVHYWRQAVVISAVVAAVATPSNDAFTMAAMTVPVVGLYFLSVLLVKLVERPEARDRLADD